MHRLFWLPGNGLVVEKDQHDRLSFRIAQVHVWTPACLWSGLLLGRIALIGLTRTFSHARC